ncbi:MAG: alpha/beta hydrolase [Deltaproteobacteria bacterium]|nr:alpha/beta hydrolase [Deltaproteobacteria bacterium]
MRVFLIHGMGRSKASLILLSSRLKRAGYDVSLYGYTVRRAPLEDIALDFVKHLELVLAKDRTAHRNEDVAHVGDAQYAIIGHSLGNIITRLAGAMLPPGFSRFIMLAPPNQSPVMARMLQENRVFRSLTGDAGQRLADEDFYQRLSIPDAPACILAGGKGPRANWLPFKGKTGDGVVSVEETRLGSIPHRVFPSIHTFIMNNRKVTLTILHFLKNGVLDDEDAPVSLTPLGAAA